MNNNIRFDDRVAIVTGAGRGMGRSYAELLASRGAAVVVNDIHDPADVVGQIESDGGRAVAHVGNAGCEADAQQLVRLAIEHFGRVDIVIHNAGITQEMSFSDITPDEFNRQLQAHLLSTFHVSRAVWPHMIAQGYGRIVGISSTSMLGSDPTSGYCAGKGGVLGLMNSLSVEGRDHGITANVVMPYAATPMADVMDEIEAKTGELSETYATYAKLFATLPSSPDLVAPPVAWLCHQDCHVTGEMFHVGFGCIARMFFCQGPVFLDPDLSIESVRDNWQAIFDCAPTDILPDCPSAGKALVKNIIAQTS